MLVFNFNRGFDDKQYARLEYLLGEKVDVKDIPCRWKPGYSLAQTAEQLVDAAGQAAGFGPKVWEITRFVINPPGLAPLALALFAEIHGRRGNFPRIISFDRRETDGEWEMQVVEITDLQKIRNNAHNH